MRHSPTSGYLAMVFAALVITCASGCATSNGDVDPEPAPAETTGKEKKKDDGKPAAPPAFNPTFDPNAQPTSGGKPTDPAPANGDQCIDNDDPGGAENVAKLLPDMDDCDNNLKEVSGVMKGAVDVDYFKISGTDKFGCSTDTEFSGTAAGTEVCVFARCKNSTVDAVTGCTDGTAATSDIGMKGCCAAAPAKATPEWDCSGVTDNDSADFFVRVKQLNGDKCLPYTVKYRF